MLWSHLCIQVLRKRKESYIIMENSTQNNRFTRRGILHAGSAALAGISALTFASAQDARGPSRESSNGKMAERSPDHHLPNEREPGPNNNSLEAENPNSVWGPETDRGTVSPFKYSFAMARKRITNGGWTRQVTVRELPISTTMAGVEMRLTAGGGSAQHSDADADSANMRVRGARR